MKEYLNVSTSLLIEGKTYSVEEFVEKYKRIDEAGKLLREINHSLAIENYGWGKNVEYTI